MGFLRYPTMLLKRERVEHKCIEVADGYGVVKTPQRGYRFVRRGNPKT